MLEELRTGERRRREDREGQDFERAKLAGDWLKWLLAMVVAAMLSYAATTNRITALEVKQETTHEQLKTIESKIDKLLSR